MPLSFDMGPIHGISAGFALEGELCTIQTEGLYSTEDGGQLICRLEAMSQAFLHRTGIMPSQIDNFLRPDKIQTLMPRIEGIMRGILKHKAGQRHLVDGIVRNQDAHSLLMPEKFKEYLLACYFRDFDMEAEDYPLARHSIAHGVSVAADYNEIAATLPFFIFDQIFYFLPSKETAAASAGCNSLRPWAPK